MAKIFFQTARLTASNPHNITRQVIVDSDDAEYDDVHDAVWHAIHNPHFDTFSPPLHQQLEDLADADHPMDLNMVERVLWERAREVTKDYASGGMFDWDMISDVDDHWRNVATLVSILEFGIRNSRPT